MTHLPAQRTAALLVGLGLLLVTLACLCGPLQQIQQVQSTVGAAQSTIGAAQATIGPVLTAANSGNGLGTVVAGAELHQWAANAGGSSQRSGGDFSFSQVTGLPNTPSCGDFGTAWASDPSEKTPILTADYATAVIPTHVVIHHSFNPGAVVEVNVGDGGSNSVVVYSGSAFKIVECPFEQTIDIKPGTVIFPVSEVIVSLNQSEVGPDEIDAIELVGIAQ